MHENIIDDDDVTPQKKRGRPRKRKKTLDTTKSPEENELK